LRNTKYGIRDEGWVRVSKGSHFNSQGYKHKLEAEEESVKRVYMVTGSVLTVYERLRLSRKAGIEPETR
jgi:hypothetical protein